MKRNVFFAMNRRNKTATILTGFSCWEMVQGAAVVGLQMPDGTMADGIGRLTSRGDFMQRAATSGYTVLFHEDFRPETAGERIALTSRVIHQSRQARQEKAEVTP